MGRALVLGYGFFLILILCLALILGLAAVAVPADLFEFVAAAEFAAAVFAAAARRILPLRLGRQREHPAGGGHARLVQLFAELHRIVPSDLLDRQVAALEFRRIGAHDRLILRLGDLGPPEVKVVFERDLVRFFVAEIRLVLGAHLERTGLDFDEFERDLAGEFDGLDLGRDLGLGKRLQFFLDLVAGHSGLHRPGYADGIKDDGQNDQSDNDQEQRAHPAAARLFLRVGSVDAATGVDRLLRFSVFTHSNCPPAVVLTGKCRDKDNTDTANIQPQLRVK